MIRKTITAVSIAALTGVGALNVLPEAAAKSMTSVDSMQIAASPCNPCAANPCGANPCAAKHKGHMMNPCNPCAANPCGPGYKHNPCNPCNPCAAKKK